MASLPVTFFTSLIFLRTLIFQHITAEGTVLVQQAEDAATNQVLCHNHFLFDITICADR